MKAITVAGGSSDDNAREETTAAGADPDNASADAADPRRTASEPETADAEAEADATRVLKLPEPDAASAPEPPAREAEADTPAAAGADADSAESDGAAGTTTGQARRDGDGDGDPDGDSGSGAAAPSAAGSDAPAASDAAPDADEDTAPESASVSGPEEKPGAGAAPVQGADRTSDAPEDGDAGTEEEAERAGGTPSQGAAPRKTTEASTAGERTGSAKEPGSATAERTQLLRIPRTPTDTDRSEKADEAGENGRTTEKTGTGSAKEAASAAAERTQLLRIPRTPTDTDRPEKTDEAQEGGGTTEGTGTGEKKPRTDGKDSDGKDSDGAQDGGEGESDRTRVLTRPAGRGPAGPAARPGDTDARVPSWARERDGGAKAAEPKAGTQAGTQADPKSRPSEKGGESDSERTSRFVALKPLDAPPPTAPRPRPTGAPDARRPEVRQPAAPAPAPLPPLDLLAELTNTTPPPETPRRTAVRRVKVWTPILLVLVGGAVGAQMLRPLPTPRLVAAEASQSVDGQFSVPWPAKGQGAVRIPGSGDVGTFGEEKPVPTASVAKVMTAYVILKGHPLRKNEAGPDITVDAKTVSEGNSEHESRIQGLNVGTKFSQQDMLKMLMIPSGNNVARLLARWDTGSDTEAAFVEKMNAAARGLGMTNTTYTDPSGLDAKTVSTAADQLKLAEAVMKDEAFRAIVALPQAPIKGLAQPLINNNTLLSVQNLSVRGIKTGSSTPAGGALMWAAYKSVGDETPLIVGTLMDQRVDGPDPDGSNSLALVLANSRKIIEGVRGALASAPLVRKGDVVGHVDDGLGGRTPLVATKDLNVIGVPGQPFRLTLKGGASPLPHTAKDGTEVGTLTAGEGDGAKSVPVAVKGALAEPSFGTRLTRVG
ncbi:D-alanyl-D-alanine carboxypeptidase family protein [Streptomyces sp. NPDC090112]|uniref:D-alanyl-D-alanine carboxypeptidase family protein n=1 Tax=Streptomyces sp. NPDC090112 TaxID=3365949 RepID=UPI00382F92DE